MRDVIEETNRLEKLADEIVERQGGEELNTNLSLYDDQGHKKSLATLLIELAGECKFFHDPEGSGYAIVTRDGVREIWPIRSTAFKQWLSGAFFKLSAKGCNNNAIADALNTLEARAVHEGKEATIHLRVARQKDRIYIDLCDEKWRVIEVTADGWGVLDSSPVYFVRKKGMTQLPIPMKGGNVEELRQFLNISKGDFELAIGWLLGAFSGKGPFPVLVLQGEQGTGKSTTTRVIRCLLDPSTVPLRPPPREIRDLLVSAVNNHLIVLDNLSGLSSDISDCLCRFATGGGFDARQLYSDLEQVLVDIQRPILVNGIDDIATRPDLAERSIILNLPVIEPSARRDERPFWEAFEAAKPRILGALLDALSCALRNAFSVSLAKKPRMADFAIWVTAAESALGWNHGSFMEAYDNNQHHAVENGLEASPVGSTLLSLMDSNHQWEGSPTQLLNELTLMAGNLAKSKAWPQSPKGLKNILKRLAPSLRRMGIEIANGRSGDRFYRITRITETPQQPSYVSKPSDALHGVTSEWTDRDAWTDNPDTWAVSEHLCVHPKPSSGRGLDMSDGLGTCPEAYVNETPKLMGCVITPLEAGEAP